MILEILDTTLRDGEQTSGVSFSKNDKLHICKILLETLNIDRIEVASARVSEGEFQAVKMITDWAAKNNFISKIEILGFIDGKVSLDWINNAGGKWINLLCKGSKKHLVEQLRKTPEEHVKAIKDILEYAQKLRISANIYLEDWSNGMRNSPDYVEFLINALKDQNIKRFMLPDTLGILTPHETFKYCKHLIDKFPDLHFDFHGHNDYDLAVANTMEAVEAGVKGIHTTINGLGERAGNTPVSSIIPALMDHLGLKLSIDEKKLFEMSQMIETYSGIKIPKNKPVIGEHVFTQASGIHADGDSKANLYFNDLLPERFGRIREYALGKTSGKANIKKNLEKLGIDLDASTIEKITKKVIELGDKKERITSSDLPYIINDILGTEIKNKVKIENYHIGHAYGLSPVATISIQIADETYEETSIGSGQYNAFMNSLEKIYKKLSIDLPKLEDYSVVIPPEGDTEALVKTIITWRLNNKCFITKGLDSDQTAAAIKATIRMLNIIYKEKDKNK